MNQKEQEAKLVAANIELVTAALAVAEIAVTAGDKEDALHALGLCRRGFARVMRVQRQVEQAPKPKPPARRPARKRVPAAERGRELLAILARREGAVSAKELATELGTNAEGVRRAAATVDGDLLSVVRDRNGGKGQPQSMYELRSLREEPAGVAR